MLPVRLFGYEICFSFWLFWSLALTLWQSDNITYC